VTNPHPETIQEPTKSHLNRKKKDTQEIQSNLGALCQKLRAEITYIFLPLSQFIVEPLSIAVMIITL
jgi:hypothetical protein